MQNDIAYYVLTALAEQAAHVARSEHDFDSLVSFGKIAAGAKKLANLCEEEGDCDRGLRRRIREYMNRHPLGGGEWYNTVLNAHLTVTKLELDEFELEDKAEFDPLFTEKYGREPPDLGDT